MAGPTVTLNFEGETAGLDSAFDRVGGGADRMADSVGRSGDRAREAGGGLDSLGDKADGAEGKFTGLGDVIGGTGDIMTSFKDGDVAGMAMGFADLAGGIAAFVVPVLGTVAGAIGTAATATWGFTTALLANPITWIVIGIIALIAVIVLLATHWDDVKRIAGIAIGWIGDKIGWLVDRGKDFLGWLTGIPGKIGGAFAFLADAISRPFKSAFNWVADAWNNTIGGLSWTVPDWVPFIGGNTIRAPRLGKFHTGGVVPGFQGAEMLAVLQAGERVVPAGGQSGGSGVTEIRFVGNISDPLAELFQMLIRTNRIQLP